jgi:CRP-like cAMP-binding protein
MVDIKKLDSNCVIRLPEGKCFGELALITHKPRAATIVALEPCHFAIMSK